MGDTLAGAYLKVWRKSCEMSVVNKQIVRDFLLCGGRSLTSQAAKTFGQISLFLKITAGYGFVVAEKPICSEGSLRLEDLGYCAGMAGTKALRPKENTRNIRLGSIFLPEILGNWIDFLLLLLLVK